MCYEGSKREQGGRTLAWDQGGSGSRAVGRTINKNVSGNIRLYSFLGSSFLFFVPADSYWFLDIGATNKPPDRVSA